MENRIETLIPGRKPIELVAFYEEFRDYYPYCELETKEWFVQNARPDWWILDVGANVGYYSILFAQLAPRGRVLAFEPTSTAGMLRKNLEHNNITNAEVHEVALGGKTGLREDRIFRIWGGEGDVKAYPFYRLDDFVSERRPERIDCIKIDVDSFDFEVLRGAEKTLRDLDPIVVVELNHALTKRNQTPSEAMAWLADRGYCKALVLDQDNFVLRREHHPSFGMSVPRSLELVFKKPSRVFEEPDNSMGAEPAASPFRSVQLTGEAALQRLGPPDQTMHSSAPRSAWQKLLAFAKRESGSPGELTLKSLVGEVIETSETRWAYGLIVHFAEPPLPNPLTIQVCVEVISGRLGIGLRRKEADVFGERTLEPMQESQQVMMRPIRQDVDSLVFRNIAPEGTKTLFRIVSIGAWTTPASSGIDRSAMSPT